VKLALHQSTSRGAVELWNAFNPKSGQFTHKLDIQHLKKNVGVV